jgi:HSP20 family protein
MLGAASRKRATSSGLKITGTLRGSCTNEAEKEEKKKDYYLRERSFGSFQRAFQVPEGVDADKIEASFKKGLLTVTLPKTAEAQKAAKKIEVKTG